MISSENFYLRNPSDDIQISKVIQFFHKVEIFSGPTEFLGNFRSSVLKVDVGHFRVDFGVKYMIVDLGKNPIRQRRHHGCSLQSIKQNYFF